MKRMITRKPFSKMAGLTLLETMFALAVGALVLIGAVIFYISTKTSATTSKVVGDMNAITAAADTYLAGGNSLADLNKGDNVVILQGAGLLPNPLNSPWGSQYTAKSTTTDGNQITITIPGLGAPAKAATGGGSAGGGTDATAGDQNCNAIWSAVQNSQGVTQGASGCSFAYTL